MTKEEMIYKIRNRQPITKEEIMAFQMNESLAEVMMETILFDNMESMKLFIEFGAIDAVDSEGRTLMHLALQLALEDSEKSSRRPEDEVDVFASTKETAEDFTIIFGFKTIIKFLKGCGVSVNARDYEDRTPMHLAVEGGLQYFIEPLIELGADVNARDYEGETPMHFAAKFGFGNIIRILGKLGANINEPNIRGGTPIHFSTNKDILTLVELGADVNARDHAGQTPISCIDKDDPQEVLDLLLIAGADISSAEKDYHERYLARKKTLALKIKNLVGFVVGSFVPKEAGSIGIMDISNIPSDNKLLILENLLDKRLLDFLIKDYTEQEASLSPNSKPIRLGSIKTLEKRAQEAQELRETQELLESRVSGSNSAATEDDNSPSTSISSSTCSSSLHTNKRAKS